MASGFPTLESALPERRARERIFILINNNQKKRRNMGKVLPFTTVLRKNMMEKDKPDLYYALAKSNGEVDIDEIAERIQRSSTVNWADVLCVLRALLTEMIESFKKGEMVRLGDMGTFYVTLRSSGVLTMKEVKENVILGARVRFRPGKEIKKAMKTLEYSKFKTEEEKNTTPDPTNPDNPTPDPNPDNGGDETPDPAA